MLGVIASSHVEADVVPPSADVELIASVVAARSGTAISATFSGYTPQVEDLVVIFAPSTTTIIAPSTPNGWANLLGPTNALQSAAAAHGLAAAYHRVTTTEASAVTTTYGITGWFSNTEVGSDTGIVLRGVGTIAGFGTTSNTSATTTHQLAAVADVGTDSLVVSFVCSDGLGTYTTPTGWSLEQSINTNLGCALYSMDALTTGSDIAATNVTVSASEEHLSITMAFAPIVADTPRVVGVPSLAYSTTVFTSITVDKPVDCQTGDLLVLVAKWQMTTDTTWSGTVSASGTTWTAITNGGGLRTHLHLWERVVDGSEGSTFTVDYSVDPTRQIAVECLRISGGEFDVAATGYSSLTTVPLPAVTTTEDDALVVSFAGGYVDFTADPAGYDEIFRNTLTPLRAWAKPQAAAGSTGTPNIGVGSGPRLAMITAAWVPT